MKLAVFSPKEERPHQNYDRPNSLETKLMVKHIGKLLEWWPVEGPVYDFTMTTAS